MTSTGFKSPLTVAQDSRREVNGGNHTCYAFSDLDNIKNNDDTYAYIPSTGGIDSLRASPVIYAYNYNFQIPLDAKITNVEVKPVIQQSNGKNYGNVTRIKTVKLKTGASTTDYGVGNNLGDTTKLECTNLNLKNGSSGDNVTELQRVLKELGYYSSTIDGSFGPVTANAVYKFQGDVGIKQDKIVGPVTCSYLHGLTNIKIPIETWSTDSTFVLGGKSIFSGAKDEWGVELTPAIVNSTNFGCVFQVTGTKYKKWVTPQVAKLQMKIDYTVNGETEDVGTSTQTMGLYVNVNGTDTKLAFDTNGVSTNNLNNILSVDTPDIGIEFKVKYTHEGSAVDSKVVSLSSTNLNISTNNYKKYSFPVIHFPDEKNKKEYVQSVVVYPGIVGGVQYLTIEHNGGINFVKLPVDSDSFPSNPEVDVKDYAKEGQFCQITNCTFKNNVSSYTRASDNTVFGDGGAIYVSTEHFKYSLKSSNFSGNVAGNGIANLNWNGDEIF